MLDLGGELPGLGLQLVDVGEPFGDCRFRVGGIFEATFLEKDHSINYTQLPMQSAFNASIVSALNAFNAGRLFAGFGLQVFIGGVVEPCRMFERDLLPASRVE